MNYYEILGVKTDATQAEIRQAYKKLIKKYHPDVYTGNKQKAEEISIQINEAYDVLSNASSRKEYDNLLNSENESNTSFSNNSNYNSNTAPNSNQTNTSTTYSDYNKYYSDSNYNDKNHHYNPYSYENYHRTQQNSEPENSFYSQFYDNHVKPAENYVSNKFDTMRLHQKIFIFLLLILLACIMILITFVEYTKFVPHSHQNVDEEPEEHFSNFTFVNEIDKNHSYDYNPYTNFNWQNVLNEIYTENFGNDYNNEYYNSTTDDDFYYDENDTDDDIDYSDDEDDTSDDFEYDDESFAENLKDTLHEIIFGY